MVVCGASAACGGFGFARNTAATFDVFYWLQVTNYGVLYVLFDSAPSGSMFVRVRDVMRTNRSPLFEIARVLVRFGRVPSVM